MNHTDIINLLIASHRYNTYLEIGVQSGKNFKQINAKDKVGVDPDRGSAATHIMNSDLFFQRNTLRFDITFIDGDHRADQVFRDIENACRVSKTVVVHDINPTSEAMQRVPRETKEWTGDGWKAWVMARHCLPFDMVCVDTDYGVGIIETRMKQQAPPEDIPSDGYADLVANRKQLLNLISIEELCKKYNWRVGR